MRGHCRGVCYQTADRNPLGRSFSDVADLIEHRYVDHVDRNALWAGAVRGMLSELGDPYSEYIAPKEAAEFEELLTRSSAASASSGLRSADRPADGHQPDCRFAGVPRRNSGRRRHRQNRRPIDPRHEVRRRNRPNPRQARRTKSSLTVERAGEEEPIDLPPIRREVINVDSVLGDTRGADDHWNFLLQKDPNIGYVRIASFGERTVEELKAALEQLASQKVQGLVLDLRNDPGGLLPAAIGVCNFFLPEGKPIVSTKGRDGQMQQQYKADGG